MRLTLTAKMVPQLEDNSEGRSTQGAECGTVPRVLDALEVEDYEVAYRLWKEGRPDHRRHTEGVRERGGRIDCHT